MDWFDIFLHIIIAAPVAAVLYMWAGGFTIWLSTIFWPARELYQHWERPMHILDSLQSFLEWTTPVASAWVAVLLMQKFYVRPKYEEGTF